LLEDPARRAEAERTINSGKLTLVGPVELIQGGVAVIGRLPVFLPDKSGNQKFWGFSIVLIPLDELLDRAELDQLSRDGFEYQLWRISPETGKRHNFASSLKGELIGPIDHSFSVPNATWHLTVTDQKAPISATTLLLEQIVVLALSISVALAMYRAQTDATRLKNEVQERTRELRKANSLLEDDVAYRTRVSALSDAINLINTVTSKASIDLSDALDEVLFICNESLGSARAVMVSLAVGGFKVERSCGYQAPQVGTFMDKKLAPELAVCASAKHPLFIVDTLADDRVNRVKMKELGIRALIVIPLLVNSQTEAIIELFYDDERRDFSSLEKDFAEKLSASISLTLENFYLHEAERSMLDTLQSALLAVPDALKGLEFGHVYRSATRRAQVGGDFYDLFELTEDTVGLLVGDVSGHGVSAANTASLVKNTVRAFTARDRSPARILHKVSEVIEQATEPGVFATAFFALIDVKTGMMRYCNAGHPPALLYRDGKVEQFTVNSGLLGAMPTLVYKVSEVQLSEDDICIVYTDGVTEARDGQEFFGEERLRQAIASLAEQRVELLPELIAKQVEKFTNGRLSDDLAILAVRLAPEK
jgi:serine phosphatase RsbU (regulator of sigma subunit)